LALFIERVFFDREAELIASLCRVVTRRALRRDCDRAFAIVDAGITGYGARPRAS